MPWLLLAELQALRRPDASEAAAQSWNSAWLLSRFFLVFLETSVVVFLFQGYLVSGTEALARTAIISGAVAGGDTFLKASRAGARCLYLHCSASNSATADPPHDSGYPSQRKQV